MNPRPDRGHNAVRDAALVLADGSVFEGEWFGADPAPGPDGAPVATGEVVFNTALTGYQEIITDPSYAGQIVTFTYPHIGNYGTVPADDESRSAFCRGVIVRDVARRRSNWRSDEDLDAFLLFHGVPGIGGIDTRRLTRIIRDEGAIPGAFAPLDLVDEAALKAAATSAPGTAGVDLVAQVTTPERYTFERLAREGAACASPPTTSGSSSRSSSSWAASPPSRCSRHRPRPPTCSPSSPTGSSCRTAPATPRWSAAPSTRSAGCSASRCPCSASASATRCSAWPPAPAP